MWTLNEALTEIRALQPEARKAGWNLHLGGGVLNNGQSNNDLDVLAMACYQDPNNEAALLAATKARGWEAGESFRLPHRHIFPLKKGDQLMELIIVNPITK